MTQQNPKHRAQWLTIGPMAIAWSLTIALSLVIVGYGIHGLHPSNEPVIGVVSRSRLRPGSRCA